MGPEYLFGMQLPRNISRLIEGVVIGVLIDSWRCMRFPKVVFQATRSTKAWEKIEDKGSVLE